MVKQNNSNIAAEINKLNENEGLAVLDYISTILTKRISKLKDNQSNDDLIVSLSDAYENKRARQVVEWERVRRQNVQRAA
ncbi:MAG: MSL1 family protein [Acidobacteriota bacterium]|nr:MSL1 family protein [Acidobacteriota bacterium]